MGIVRNDEQVVKTDDTEAIPAELVGSHAPAQISVGELQALHDKIEALHVEWERSTNAYLKAREILELVVATVKSRDYVQWRKIQDFLQKDWLVDDAGGDGGN